MNKKHSEYEVIANISDCEFWQHCYQYDCMFKQGNEMPKLILVKDDEQILIRCKSQVEV